MNILYATFSFSTGGIERLLADIVNEAAKEKSNNIYLCIINDSYDQYLLSTVNSNVNIILLRRGVGGRKIKYILEYTKFILRNEIDIIHCQTENLVKFSTLSKIIKPKIKVFTTVHDTYFLNLKSYEVIIDKLVCSKIIAISEIVKQQIILRGVSEEKVVKIYNAIDLQKFKILKDKVYVYKDQIVIGNVARIVPEKKGQDVLINAISLIKEKYPNIKCLFAGEAPHNKLFLLDRLENLCKNLDIKDNIVFCGNIEDVSKFLDLIDIFVLPSRYEGFGISLIEAMYKGIPCIATNIDGPKEIIKNNKYGLLFENNDYRDLANKIEYRINNMKINNKEIKDYIGNNFNIKFMVKELIQLYDS